MLVHNLVRKFGITLGLISEDDPNIDELTRLYQAQNTATWIGLVAAALGFLSLFVLISTGGLNWDRIFIFVILCSMVTLLHTVRMLTASSHAWRVMLIASGTNFESLHQAFGRLSVSLLPLHEAIAKIPEGWMSSFGLQNVSRHNQPHWIGPACFLWRPEIETKAGKLISQAVSGYGDTIADAILDAISKIEKP